MSILEALGISEFPAPDSLNKVLNDHLVAQRATELAVEHFAAEAIQKMHPVERQALIKRISPPPKPLHQVGWKVQPGLQSGKPRIVGNCGRCGQDCHYDGKPSAAKDVTWSHCSLGPSRISEAVIETYAAQFGFTS
jgi:hypothetical protein